MIGAKAMGSLSSNLLARKGHARPAMRSQGFGGFSGLGQGIEDLGWNDMGGGEAAVTGQPAPAPAPPLAPPPTLETPVEPTPIDAHVVVADLPAAPVPQVLIERDTLAELITAPVVVNTVSPATAARHRRETARTGKAAFTLRLDADRHLRLRLTSAVTNRSAQHLLIDALDALLKSVVEVDALVAQLPPPPTRKR